MASDCPAGTAAGEPKIIPACTAVSENSGRATAAFGNQRARNRDIHRQRDQTADVFLIYQPAAACDVTQQQSREDGHKSIKDEHDDASALLPLRFHERTNVDARFPRCFRLGRCKPVAQISAAGAYIIDRLD
jgi:hypothetical protein